MREEENGELEEVNGGVGELKLRGEVADSWCAADIRRHQCTFQQQLCKQR